MKPIEVTETIHAPLEQVFAVATDLPNMDTWISGIESIEMLTDPPVAEGTRWRETRIMFKKASTEEMWITEWDPPHGYVVEAESCGCHYKTTISFTQNPDASTNMTMSFTGTPQTFMAKIMMKIFAAMANSLRKAIAQDLRDIKTHCESPPEEN
jgi:uncharacterized membrane protein